MRMFIIVVIIHVLKYAHKHIIIYRFALRRCKKKVGSRDLQKSCHGLPRRMCPLRRWSVSTMAGWISRRWYLWSWYISGRLFSMFFFLWWLSIYHLCFFGHDIYIYIYIYIYIHIHICHLLVYLSMVNRFINQLLCWGLRLVDVANTSLGGTMALVLILAMCNILTGISPDNEMCFPGTAERSDFEHYDNNIHFYCGACTHVPNLDTIELEHYDLSMVLNHHDLTKNPILYQHLMFPSPFSQHFPSTSGP